MLIIHPTFKIYLENKNFIISKILPLIIKYILKLNSKKKNLKLSLNLKTIN
jgi:hypothetical protein